MPFGLRIQAKDCAIHVGVFHLWGRCCKTPPCFLYLQKQIVLFLNWLIVPLFCLLANCATASVYTPWTPPRGGWHVWRLTPVWNFRAVLWFPFLCFLLLYYLILLLFLSFQVYTISILLFPEGRSGTSDILLLSGIAGLSFFFLFPISSLVFSA